MSDKVSNSVVRVVTAHMDCKNCGATIRTCSICKGEFKEGDAIVCEFDRKGGEVTHSHKRCWEEA